MLSELTTSPIVVRGRSPRNFQARKEIPLLGSSAGSRGQTLVETGHGIVAQAVILNKPPYDSRPRVSSMELPRTAFTFSAPKQMPQSPMQMRSNSYPTTWNPSSQVSMPHNPGSASYPASSMAAADPYPKMPLSGTPNYTAEPQEMQQQQQQQTSMPSVQLSLAAQDQQQPPPIRTQYATYVQGTSAPPHLSLSTTSDNSLNVPRYVDSNPRPSKSPRHAGHQSIHSAGSLSNDTSSGEYRYGPPYVGGVNSASSEISPQSQHPPPPGYGTPSQEASSAPSSAPPNAPPPRDYFPPSQSWTTTAGEPSAPSVSYNSNGNDRPYAYPSTTKSEHPQQQSAPPPPHSAAYGGVSHYAWNAT